MKAKFVLRLIPMLSVVKRTASGAGPIVNSLGLQAPAADTAERLQAELTVGKAPVKAEATVLIQGASGCAGGGATRPMPATATPVSPSTPAIADKYSPVALFRAGSNSGPGRWTPSYARVQHGPSTSQPLGWQSTVVHRRHGGLAHIYIYTSTSHNIMLIRRPPSANMAVSQQGRVGLYTKKSMAYV